MHTNDILNFTREIHHPHIIIINPISKIQMNNRTPETMSYVDYIRGKGFVRTVAWGGALLLRAKGFRE